MTTAPDGFVVLPDGGRIAYEITGDAHPGEPVLLVRPLAGSRAMWGEFGEALAREFRVIAYDLRGVGQSSDAPLGVDTRSMARDALSLLDALAVPRVRVFGISLGAMVATWLAVDAPGRVVRLCLAAAGPVGLSVSPSLLGVGVEVVASMLAPKAEVLGRLSEAVTSPTLRAEDPARADAIDDAAGEETVRRGALVHHGLAAARHDARDVLGQITAPTLVLIGSRDPIVAIDQARALAEGIAGGRLEVLEDVGHDFSLEQPAETARRVARFFRGEDA